MKWPLRWTRRTASHSSSLMLTRTRSRRTPALLTRTWRPPKASTAALMSRWPASQSATLSALAMASPPMALISSTTCWAGVRSSPEPSMAPPRSLTTTLAPSEANSSACSRPMPRPAPVMTATRPSSAPISVSFRSNGREPAPSPALVRQACGTRSQPPRRRVKPPDGAHMTSDGVEVDPRAPMDALAGGGVGEEHDTSLGRAVDVGHRQPGLAQHAGGVVDRVPAHVGHGDEVGALGHAHRHRAVPGHRGPRGGRCPHHRAGGNGVAEVVPPLRVEPEALQLLAGPVVGLAAEVGDGPRSGPVRDGDGHVAPLGLEPVLGRPVQDGPRVDVLAEGALHLGVEADVLQRLDGRVLGKAVDVGHGSGSGALGDHEGHRAVLLEPGAGGGALLEDLAALGLLVEGEVHLDAEVGPPQ